ncbi:hypothetical protein Pla52o_37290 [Novipirellula galeiformis]|uniref:Uncharacterized protein n=1 Tax=Novipirellula galeiformis TaxID=2528004 RepID=A0A5C6CBS7_9BACT|nr:hypothetical protein [Novipirellula galeiformis]TWU21542.1 hypothetical protein Pla52o_37290 [Novipirellula galeiformis]
MTWFEQLTGIDEVSPEYVRSQISVEDDCLVLPNDNRIAFGRLETPTLSELRARVAAAAPSPGRLKIREMIADVRQLHADVTNAGAMFQVASQFNLLEMTGPSVTPERGVGIYEHDRTQGPACAISCGAGTIFRNYFAAVGDRIGQTADHQIDCASDLGVLLGNQNGKLWGMQNGYLIPTDEGLQQISTTLQRADEAERDHYRSTLRIGLQWNTAVTLPGARHRVSQAYASALPVAYGRQPESQWADVARLVLEAAYESTFCAAILNRQSGIPAAANSPRPSTPQSRVAKQAPSSNKLYLTLLGGGVFGNADAWIIDAIERSLQRYRDVDLEVAIVSYGASKPAVASLVRQYA